MKEGPANFSCLSLAFNTSRAEAFQVQPVTAVAYSPKGCRDLAGAPRAYSLRIFPPRIKRAAWDGQRRLSFDDSLATSLTTTTSTTPTTPLP